MVRSLFWAAVFTSLSLASPGFAQIPGPPASGQNLLDRALVLADLYNWADAAPSLPAGAIGLRTGWGFEECSLRAAGIYSGQHRAAARHIARRFARVRD